MTTAPATASPLSENVYYTWTKRGIAAGACVASLLLESEVLLITGLAIGILEASSKLAAKLMAVATTPPLASYCTVKLVISAALTLCTIVALTTLAGFPLSAARVFLYSVALLTPTLIEGSFEFKPSLVR